MADDYLVVVGTEAGLHDIGDRLLAEPAPVDTLLTSLCADFAVDEAQCRADVQPFLDRMTSIGDLEVGAD